MTDLLGSVDFAPHAFTDGKTYETYAAANAEANLYQREIAASTGENSRMIRRRVWEQNGKKRDEKGAWVFALSRYAELPAERKRKPKTTQPVAA